MFDVLPMPFMFGLNALQASPSGAELDFNHDLCLPDFPLNPNLVSTQTCPLTQGAFSQGLPGDVTARGLRLPDLDDGSIPTQTPSGITSCSGTLTFRGSSAQACP